MTSLSSSDRVWTLLGLLADGEFHSGDVLASQLGISRASVCNALGNVADYGVTLQRIRGRGYRLARPWQPLQCDQILRFLGKNSGDFSIEIMRQAPSSNTLLLERSAKGAERNALSGNVLAVELQTAGRGRMGKAWHSSLGSSLTFSLLWRFDRGLNALSGLSLIVGLAIVRALNKLNVQKVQLKWPNDILTEQGKLGGILIETQGDMLGPSTVVIGIGINCTLTNRLVQKIDQPASALEDVCMTIPSRNQLLALLLQELALVLKLFGKDGFPVFRKEWERYHINQNLPVHVNMPDGTTMKGIAKGVDDSGMLLLETQKGLRILNSGEIR